MPVIQGEKLSNIYPHRKSISFILDYAFWMVCIGFDETKRDQTNHDTNFVKRRLDYKFGV